ncbi:MAG: holo-ACP synthase [Chitinophagaceae bacterium]|nr:holo-ACP synthase [Chitinophagaceae bacterium]
MINGVGVDIVEVERIAASINKEKGFRELVFSAHEINYCESKAKKFEHYAARFAAKEAFFKAIGTGWAEGTAFNEIEIHNDETGKPHIRLLGKTAVALKQLKPDDIQVSLSHTGSMGMAVVMIVNAG